MSPFVEETCSCPFCKEHLPDDYVIIRRSSLNQLSVCYRCGYIWESNIHDPKRCPNCGSYKWEEPHKPNRCLRCDHEWTPRGAGRSARCPACRCRDWDNPVDKVVVKKTKLEPKPKNDDSKRFRHGTYESMMAMDAAQERCSKGTGVVDAAIEFNVPIFDLILRLKKEGIRFKI